MLEYWLWLSGRRGLGVRGLRALLEQFGTPEAVYCASDAEYPSDIRPDGRTSLADKELAPARQILQQCYRQCIHIVTLQDAVYPQRLKNIDDAPLVLYYQGVLPDFDAEPVIAMVGTRRASAYGLLQAKRLGYELGRYGELDLTRFSELELRMYTLIKAGIASKTELESVYTLDEALKLYALYRMDQDIERGRAKDLQAEADRK